MQSYDVSPRRKALNKDRDEDTGEDIHENLTLMSQRVPRGNAMGNVSRPQSALLRAPRAIFLLALLLLLLLGILRELLRADSRN